jgi:hypothetical protein
METHGSIGAGEAAALALVRDSRARVAWGGYPAWYWLATGAGMGALSYAMLLPFWLAMAASAALGAGLVMVARAAGRARGVREGWACGAMTFRDSAVLYGPAALLILAGAATLKLAPWSAPWPPVVTAVLVFILIAGAGLARGARAARR